jgi:hypothetical protein
LRGDRCIATFMSDDKKTGKIKSYSGVGVAEMPKFDINVPGTIEFKYFSDTLNNFARIS